ncbi:hypothetical protein Dimus_037455 [Dionaea muscipula]
MVRFRGPDGEIVEQRVRYEWMLIKCIKCAKWGHKPDSCTSDRLTSPGPTLTWKKKLDRAPQRPLVGVGQGPGGGGLAVKAGVGVGSAQNTSGKDDWQIVRRNGKGVLSKPPESFTQLAGKGAFDPLLSIESSELSESIVPPDICDHDHRSVEYQGPQ